MTRSRTAVFVLTLGTLMLFALPAVAQAGVIERVSVNTAGVQGDDGSYSTSLSADGRYVAFYSYASNLVAGDTNNGADIFVRDRVSGVTTRVSVSTGGGETPFFSNSYDPDISADGRYVAFESEADNLVASDTNASWDIFVHDRNTGATTRVSVTNGGAQANGNSRRAAISGDGRYVVFGSDAGNLVAGDANGTTDVFVRDRDAGTTTRVSVSTAGVEGNGESGYPSISDSGRYVAFHSDASTLVGRDTNGATDVFVRDRTLNQTERVSLSTDETAGNGDSTTGTISPDGRYVGFSSFATNLVFGDTNAEKDVFVRDRTAETTERVSVATGGGQGDDISSDSALSSGGRYVVFSSHASNLVAAPWNGWQQVYVRDRQTGVTTRVSVNSAGAPGEGACGIISITADGSLVAFTTEAPNLVDGDTNTHSDVFMTVGHVTYASHRGTDRYDTAIKLSQAIFGGTLPAGAGLVVAPGETFPEALCGAPLAAAYGGPVLLTYQSALANNVKAELQCLAPDYVFCIGLSAAAVDSVKDALPGATVNAINGSGGSAYHMSYLVAKALGNKVGNMTNAVGIVTIGTTFPDAIGLSPLACARLWPVLLTNYSGGQPMNAYAVQAMTELGITSYIKAGTYAPDPSGIGGLANLSGLDRYETCAKVAVWAKASAGLTFAHTGFATGDKFPDALAAGPYLAADDGILLLSPLNGPLPAVIAATLTANAAAVQHVTFIACIEPVIGQVKALLP